MARENFTLIQALRGSAALWVVLFHLEKGGAISDFTGRLPGWLTYAVFGYGSAGVAVFFVLSGFVIAHSLSGKELTGKGLGSFALRRSVRLDPPYWVSIAFTVCVGTVLALAKQQTLSFPTLGQLLAHVLYMQVVLRRDEIQEVYWTLTYEIQFYIVFASSMWLSRRFGKAALIFWSMYVLALWSAFRGTEWAIPGLFVNLWQGFFLGVLSYRAGYLREGSWPLLILACVTFLGQKSDAGVFATPCAVTALSLFVAARRGLLPKAFAGRGWQTLGAVSYSLYLVHMPTIRLFAGLWQRIVGRGFPQDAAAAGLLLLACGIVTIIFYIAIERPSHRAAQRLFRRTPKGPEFS